MEKSWRYAAKSVVALLCRLAGNPTKLRDAVQQPDTAKLVQILTRPTRQGGGPKTLSSLAAAMWLVQWITKWNFKISYMFFLQVTSKCIYIYIYLYYIHIQMWGLGKMLLPDCFSWPVWRTCYALKRSSDRLWTCDFWFLIRWRK